MANIFSQWRKHGFLVVLILLTAYFFLSALQGNAGLFRYFQLSAEREVVAETHKDLLAKRENLELLTERLSDDYLDLDLLDEQARNRLGMVREDERILH